MRACISSCYQRILLTRWVLQRRDGTQLYIDDDNNTWHFSAANMSSVGEHAVGSTVLLWERHKHQQVWGEENGSLEAAYDAVCESVERRLSVHQLAKRIRYSSHWDDHIARIVLFVYAIHMDIPVAPLILRSSGELIDGYHRLVAYAYCAIDEVPIRVLDD